MAIPLIPLLEQVNRLKDTAVGHPRRTGLRRDHDTAAGRPGYSRKQEQEQDKTTQIRYPQESRRRAS